MTKDAIKEDVNELKKAVGKGKNKASEAFEKLTGQFFSSPQGLKFYVESDGIPIEIESETFEGLIADRKYQAGEGLPSGDEIANIRRLARYRASKNIKEIGVRSARFKDTIIYDPARPDGEVYFITREGYVLRTPDQPYIVRYTGMLEAPIKEGTLQDHLDLVRLWALDKKSEILSIGLDFSRFIPDIPHAIENIDGPHGSGKTSYTETKRAIFDPNGAPTQSLKFDERDLSISAVHQGMLAFDNVNTALPDYISDIICRLTTGQGFRTRELYTNTGEVILKLKRPIIINGINRASYKPDFIDRECPMHLGVMPESKRMTDAEIRARAEVLIPKVRGFLISIIPKAMELYSTVEAELRGKLPRMADFVIWGECGIRAMGFPAMSFYDAYMEAKHNETVDVARDTLIVTAIQGLMANRQEWTGTTKDLLDSLEAFVTDNQRKSKAFPRDERRLGRVLRELISTLREVGLEITDLKNSTHEKKITKIGETYKVNSTNSTNQNNPTENGFGVNVNDQKTNFENSLFASNTNPVKSDVQSKNAISAINNHESGNAPPTGKTDIDSVKSDVQNENSGFYRYRVLKDFSLYGRTYHPGIEFVFLKKLDGEVSKGNLLLVEEASTVKNSTKDDKDHKDMEDEKDKEVRAYIDNLKRQLSENPKKALFDFVENEAPKTKYRSMTAKAIHDMIPDPEIGLKQILDLCEELTREGAFIKNKAGAYCVNAEFLNGGGYQ
jgi:hypothetical protein